MPETDPHILFEKRGALGLITLNRPKALNALTHGMCIGMRKTLAEWAGDSTVRSVAIQGAGPRAFCAGGDIRSMAESSSAGTPAAARFLRDEYQLNALIGAYPKPYVALTHGVVMGGGAGVSVHGRYRLAGEDLAFAMPETGIGFVPDIGSSFFLSRCPGETGLYLGLTGIRIGLGDALALGLATHSVAQSDHAALIARLADGTIAAEAVGAFARIAPPALLAEHRARIGTIFAASSVETVLERLDRDGSDFAMQTARLIRTRSPESLKLTFRLLHEGRDRSLNECLKMEYRVAARRVMSADFREGVRAVLIDKDGAPHWSPNQLADVKEADIAGYFASLGGNEIPLA
ncbi:MAG: enoyl-CoA hydratase/isomerase family protein [Pseudomonadota bacterium]